MQKPQWMSQQVNGHTNRQASKIVLEAPNLLLVHLVWLQQLIRLCKIGEGKLWRAVGHLSYWHLLLHICCRQYRNSQSSCHLQEKWRKGKGLEYHIVWQLCSIVDGNTWRDGKADFFFRLNKNENWLPRTQYLCASFILYVHNLYTRPFMSAHTLSYIYFETCHTESPSPPPASNKAFSSYSREST